MLVVRPDDHFTADLRRNLLVHQLDKALAKRLGGLARLRRPAVWVAPTVLACNEGLSTRPWPSFFAYKIRHLRPVCSSLQQFAVIRSTGERASCA